MIPKPKKTKNKRKALIDKLDKAFQIWGRAEYNFCFICGSGYSCLHHFIHKAQSTNLRWDKQNGVPICGRCHQRLHSRNDASETWIIEDRMSNRFGDDWKRYIQKEKVKMYKPGIKELEELLEEFKPKASDLFY